MNIATELAHEANSGGAGVCIFGSSFRLENNIFTGNISALDGGALLILGSTLTRTEQVNLSVYDILRRAVSVLVNEKREAGVHEVQFDGSGLTSGVYFYRLQAGDFVQTRKLLLLRGPSHHW